MKQCILILLSFSILYSCKKDEETFYPDYAWHIKCKFDKDSVQVIFAQKVGYITVINPGTDSAESILNTHVIDSNIHWVNRDGIDFKLKGFSGTRNAVVTIVGNAVYSDVNFYLNDDLQNSYKLLVSDTSTIIQEIGD